MKKETGRSTRQQMREKILRKLKKLTSSSDFEAAHEEADKTLIYFLKAIGETEIAETYDAVGKWYG